VLQDVENPDTKEIETVYRPGDSALGVMRDLKKLWRKDDTDDERTVFRCFAKSGLCSELIALLEECTGRGQSGRKIALAAADLLAALTWPIDVQQELKDMMDDTEAVVTDYADVSGTKLIP
jgi:replication fork protection complex subunit Tof1/Swi1